MLAVGLASFTALTGGLATLATHHVVATVGAAGLAVGLAMSLATGLTGLATGLAGLALATNNVGHVGHVGHVGQGIQETTKHVILTGVLTGLAHVLARVTTSVGHLPYTSDCEKINARVWVKIDSMYEPGRDM